VLWKRPGSRSLNPGDFWLAEQTENSALAKVLAAVRNDLDTGLSLSAALSKHDNVFPPLMIKMVRVGEVEGFLDGVSISAAEHMGPW